MIDFDSLPTKEDFTFSGADIMKLRSRFGMSREKFAQFLGVATGSVWSWETNGVRPSNLAMEKLLDLVNRIQEKRIDKDF